MAGLDDLKGPLNLDNSMITEFSIFKWSKEHIHLPLKEMTACLSQPVAKLKAVWCFAGILLKFHQLKHSQWIWFGFAFF